MAPDRRRANVTRLLAAVLVWLCAGHAAGQTTRARGDFDKAVPAVSPEPAPAPMAAPPVPQQPPEQAPRRPAAQPQRQDAAPAAPPVIIWQPSEAPPARPAPGRPGERAAATPASSPSAPDAMAAPRAAADAFYRTYLQLRPIPGLPNATQRLRLRAHMSPPLDAAFAAAAKADQDNQRQGGGVLQEGDMFTSLAEGAGNASIGDCQAEGQRVACVVRLTARQGQEWQDRIVLAKVPAGWRVDDIVYGGQFGTGNFGTLRESLAMLVRHVTPTPAPPSAGQPPQPAAQ